MNQPILTTMNDILSAIKSLETDRINRISLEMKFSNYGELIPVNKAAKIIGRTTKTVDRMVKAGELKAYVSKTGFKSIYKKSIIDLLWNIENK